MANRGGAVLRGKTNSSLMRFRGTCDDYLFGASRNPFDQTKNTGGSSGGSAAAVADGPLPTAEGTDAGGSIRIPSAWCGVYGSTCCRATTHATRSQRELSDVWSGCTCCSTCRPSTT